MSGELPKGMKPWDGGDAAPADWDQGPVMLRNGVMDSKPHYWFHARTGGACFDVLDIVAYTPMNPHQKPQEDVVVTQEDISAAKRWKGVWGSFADCLPVMDLAFAFARHRLFGYEAGRRDMREAAGKVADDAARAYQPTLIGALGKPNLLNAARQGEAERIATAIRALPTEPLGGEAPQDNCGPE